MQLMAHGHGWSFQGAALCLMLKPFREETGSVLQQNGLSKLESGDAGEAVFELDPEYRDKFWVHHLSKA